MRSSHADYFNHDEDAPEYDDDVLNENDPIRAGYDAVLDWVVEHAQVDGLSRVLELGSGTGNLTARLPDCRELVCVDVSEKMEALGGEKLTHFSNRRFIKDDVLAAFDRDLGSFDTVVSTYTLHHLTESEKRHLFGCVWASLNENGVFVVGDLMAESEKDVAEKIEKYRLSDNPLVAEALEEEFFWRLDSSLLDLTGVGFSVQTRRFSDLSHGIVAKKLIQKK